MNLEDLTDFTFNLKILLENSDDVTKLTVHSIDSLDIKITESYLRLEKIFGHIENQHVFINNINKTVDELESFLDLYETIENDKLRICDGPLGAFNDYIDKLIYIKSIDEFHWLKEMSEISNSNNLKLLLVKYNYLLTFGEKVLVREFKDVIKHYSNQECLNSFIDHLSEFNTDEKIEQNLFIPIETLSKLEQICWWFIKQEQMYELYNECGEHCDINQKLKYFLTRSEYLKLVIRTHRSILAEKATEKNNRENETLSLFERFNKIGIKSSKATERIELFASNLDFCLRVLKHENMLIENVYYRSKETRVELISKLTILVIDSIQNEFEDFFVNEHDFSKMSHNGINVVNSIINLIIKVQNLKRKASCLQTEDLPSASKLLKFSLHLNEMGAQIFGVYLEVVKTGYFNTYIVPTNCFVHEYCIKTLNLCRLMNKEELGLRDSIKNACELPKNLSTKIYQSKSEASVEPAEYKLVRNKRARKQTNVPEDDDDNFSSRNYLAKYFSILIEKLICFLVEETEKFSSKNHIILSDSLTDALRFDKLNDFKDALKSLKIFIFLVNNLEYIKAFINELNLMELFYKIDPEFENNLNKNILSNMNKACDMFKFLARKWTNLGESESNTHKSSINPFIQSKAKKRNDFLVMLHETIVVCTRVVIFTTRTNHKLKLMITDMLKPVLDELNKTGELNRIFMDLGIDSRDINLIFDKIFPIKI